MNADNLETDASRFRAARIAITVAAVAALSACAAVVVWLVGLDWPWAVGTVLAFGIAGVAFAKLKFVEPPA